MNDDNTFTVMLHSGENKEMTLEELESLKDLENVEMVWATTCDEHDNWESTPVSLLELGFPETKTTLLNHLKTKNKEKELALSTMLSNMESWDKTLVKELKTVLMEALKLL